MSLSLILSINAPHKAIWGPKNGQNEKERLANIFPKKKNIWCTITVLKATQLNEQFK